MAEPMDLGEDDGFIEVRFPGGGSQTLDLVSAYNRLVKVGNDHQGDGDAYNVALVETCQALGLPPLSQAAARKFTARVYQRVADISKKNSLVTESPASSATSAAP